MGERRVQAQFAAAAHFEETDSSHGSDKGKSRHQRKEQRQSIVAEGQDTEGDAEKRVDQAEKREVGGHRPEVVEALRQCVFDVLEANLADAHVRDSHVWTGKNMKARHLRSS